MASYRKWSMQYTLPHWVRSLQRDTTQVADLTPVKTLKSLSAQALTEEVALESQLEILRFFGT